MDNETDKTGTRSNVSIPHFSTCYKNLKQVFLLPGWNKLMSHTITFLPLDTGRQGADAASESFCNSLVAALRTAQSSLLIGKFVVDE